MADHPWGGSYGNGIKIKFDAQNMLLPGIIPNINDINE